MLEVQPNVIFFYNAQLTNEETAIGDLMMIIIMTVVMIMMTLHRYTLCLVSSGV